MKDTDKSELLEYGIKHCPIIPNYKLDSCEPPSSSPGLVTPAILQATSISILGLNFVMLMIIISYIIWDKNRNITYIYI